MGTWSYAALAPLAQRWSTGSLIRRLGGSSPPGRTKGTTGVADLMTVIGNPIMYTPTLNLLGTVYLNLSDLAEPDFKFTVPTKCQPRLRTRSVFGTGSPRNCSTVALAL